MYNEQKRVDERRNLPNFEVLNVKSLSDVILLKLVNRNDKLISITNVVYEDPVKTSEKVGKVRKKILM